MKYVYALFGSKGQIIGVLSSAQKAQTFVDLQAERLRARQVTVSINELAAEREMRGVSAAPSRAEVALSGIGSLIWPCPCR